MPVVDYPHFPGPNDQSQIYLARVGPGRLRRSLVLGRSAHPCSSNTRRRATRGAQDQRYQVNGCATAPLDHLQADRPRNNSHLKNTRRYQLTMASCLVLPPEFTNLPLITDVALCGEELPEAVRDHVDPINDHELVGVVDDHEAASIRRCWSTWNALCAFLYTSAQLAANSCNWSVDLRRLEHSPARHRSPRNRPKNFRSPWRIRHLPPFQSESAMENRKLQPPARACLTIAGSRR